VTPRESPASGAVGHVGQDSDDGEQGDPTHTHHARVGNRPRPLGLDTCHGGYCSNQDGDAKPDEPVHGAPSYKLRASGPMRSRRVSLKAPKQHLFSSVKNAMRVVVALSFVVTVSALDPVVPGSQSKSSSRVVPAGDARQIFFDDFSYSRREQLESRGWIVRSGAGWPGVPGARWDPAGVSLSRDSSGSNRVLQLTASTDGTPSNTRHVQVCHQRKYGEGTYAARVRFSDDALSGPDGDEVVETFYTISPLREPMALEYSEIDFEYLPNGGWGRDGPILFTTTWETFNPEPNWKANNVHQSKVRSYVDWHTLVVQVANGEVRYFVDGEPFATHSGDFYPESLMSMNFNVWFTRHGLAAGGEVRQYRQEVDWVLHAARTVLTPSEVAATVSRFRKAGVAFTDTVPQAVPPLESPCNL